MAREIDMNNGPLLPSLIKYTIPIILTGVLQLLFNAADLVIVGQFCGSVCVAAVGATGAIINLLVQLFIGISVGVGITSAHALGAKEDAAASRIVHTAIPTALISGILLTVVGVVLSPRLLTLMATPEEILPLSTVYMKIYFMGITASLLYNFGAAILRAAGDTRSPMIFLTISGIFNVLLNVIFITVFGMDVDGVALATIISQFLSAFLVIAKLIKRNDACKLQLKRMRIYKGELWRILKIGVPAGLQSCLFSFSNVLIQSSVNSFGAVVVSGNAAATNIEGFLYAAMHGFSQSAMNFTGRTVGAKNYERSHKAFKYCLVSVTVVGVAIGLLFYVFSRGLLSIYITDSKAAIEIGVVRMAYFGFTYFLCGMMNVVTGAIQGWGRSLSPMIITLIGVCGLRILWIYTVFQIPSYHSIESLYISYPISWTLTLLAELILYRRIVKKARG